MVGLSILDIVPTNLFPNYEAAGISSLATDE